MAALLGEAAARGFVAAEELICPPFHTLTQLNAGLENARVIHLMPRSRREDVNANLPRANTTWLDTSGRADATAAHSRRHLALLPAG